MKRKLVIVAGACLFLLAAIFGMQTHVARAAFGISPPYFKNEGLTRSSHYEQKIVLVRGDPVEDLQAKITVNVPGADEWITVDRGFEFVLPKGERQVPIVLSVDVPKKARFADYKGNIRVVISPFRGPQAGTVGIVLGAQIDVDLNVIDKKILDFKVWTVNVSDVEEGRNFWWMYFPGKIRFTMQIENVGNIDAAPSRVEFDIRDPQGKLVEQTRNTGRIRKIPPFKTEQVIAYLPTKVKASAYSATYRIFKGTEVVREEVLDLSVLPKGALPGYSGYGLRGLPLRDQAILVIFAVLIFCLVSYGVFKGIQAIRRRR